jgi:hypothetical protein
MTEARRTLPETVRCFAKRGADAEPIFFGAHRRPEGVMLSYARYRQMLDMLDDMAIELEVRRRDRQDDGARVTLSDLIRQQGLDPADFGV